MFSWDFDRGIECPGPNCPICRSTPLAGSVVSTVSKIDHETGTVTFDAVEVAK